VEKQIGKVWSETEGGMSVAMIGGKTGWGLGWGLCQTNREEEIGRKRKRINSKKEERTNEKSREERKILINMNSLFLIFRIVPKEGKRKGRGGRTSMTLRKIEDSVGFEWRMLSEKKRNL